MKTIHMRHMSIRQLKYRPYTSWHCEFYKERMPEAGVRRFLGHIIRRTKHATWKDSPRWIVENHPGFQYTPFMSKEQATTLLWHEHRSLVEAVNEIEHEQRKNS